MSGQFMGVFTIGQTIDRGIKLYKMIFARMFILLLIPMLLMTLPVMKGMAIAGAHSGNGAIGILYLLGAIASGWSYIIMVRYIYVLSIGETVPSFGALLKLATPKDFLFIITGIIWFFTIIIAYILLIVPGIYLTNLAMLLAYPVCIVERRYFFNGIGRIMALGKKRWWKTCAIGSITMLIVLVPFMVGYLIFIALLVKSMAGSAGISDPETVTKAGFSIGAMIGMFIYSAIAALVMPLWPAVAIIHYNSLRSEKESSDLAGQLDALDAPKA